MKVACYTSFSFAYLGKARVLASTLKSRHPDWDLHALITDEQSKEISFAVENEDFDYVIWSKDLRIPEFDQWVANHTVVEACTAVKGVALFDLATRDYDVVIYFDPDIAVFDSLDPIVEILETHEICLTPHQLTPERAGDMTAILDNEVCSLDHGTYNLGFIAIRTGLEGLRFARWWKERLVHFCKDDIPRGLFTDQRWCDLVPALFDKTFILRDPGYNVASWNLSQRTIRITGDGQITVNGSPLRFFHYTKLGPVARKMTERYAGDNTEVYELWRWYRDRVEAFSSSGIAADYWHYGGGQ